MNGAKPDPDDDFAEIEQEASKWFEEFKNRTIYTELNSEIIRGIPDAKLPQAIVDFIGCKIDCDWENDLRKVPSLGPGFAAVYFLLGLQIEVNNGGFNQFFYNRGRDAVVRAKEGAELLGLSGLAAVVSMALEIEHREREQMARVKEAGTLQDFLESYDDIHFDGADDAFMDLQLDLDQAVVSFIRSNITLFEGRAE